MAIDKIYHLTAADQVAMQAGANDPNKFFAHFFHREGDERSFQLDYNFTDNGKWQVEFVMASQTFVVVVAGVGTGKSLATIMGAAYFSVMFPDFRFLNIAKDAQQAQVTYELLIEQMDGTLFEKLVTSYPQRPYPKITIEYYIGKTHVKSVLSFFGLGDSGDATNVFSKRYDWANIEEAGLIDNLAEVVQNLSTRLTGATSRGRTYMGRLSLISNAWPNQELWRLFDTAAMNNPEGLAINVDTRDNKSVTEKQIKNSINLTEDGDYDRFMTGKRPEDTGRYFMRDVICRGENDLLDAILKKAYKEKDENYQVFFHQHLGIYHYRMPVEKGRIYFILGDPGTGAAPNRNAPCIMVWDVTEFAEVDNFGYVVPRENPTDYPKFASLVAFYWGNGYGSIMPFVNKLLEWIDYYGALFAGVDSTSTQKNTNEVINLQWITGKGKSIEYIKGEDFSAGRRYGMLIALRVTLEAGMMQWPRSVIGVSSQLGAYDPLLDRAAASKLPQDIVATMGMAAWEFRDQFRIIEEELTPEVVSEGPDYRRSSRRDGSRRSAESRTVSS